MSTQLERLHIHAGIQPTTRKEIATQLERERKYRLHLMTHEPDAAKRRVLIAASTERTKQLNTRMSLAIWENAQRKDRTP